jgi:hypothetical protein
MVFACKKKCAGTYSLLLITIITSEIGAGAVILQAAYTSWIK